MNHGKGSCLQVDNKVDKEDTLLSHVVDNLVLYHAAGTALYHAGNAVPCRADDAV